MKVEIMCADSYTVNTKAMQKKKAKRYNDLSMFNKKYKLEDFSIINEKYPALNDFGFEVSKNGKAFIHLRGVKDIVRLSRAIDCELIFDDAYTVMIYDNYIE